VAQRGHAIATDSAIQCPAATPELCAWCDGRADRARCQRWTDRAISTRLRACAAAPRPRIAPSSVLDRHLVSCDCQIGLRCELSASIQTGRLESGRVSASTFPRMTYAVARSIWSVVVSRGSDSGLSALP